MLLGAHPVAAGPLDLVEPGLGPFERGGQLFLHLGYRRAAYAESDGEAFDRCIGYTAA